MTEMNEEEELWNALQSQIRTNDLEIVFLKADGSERTMHCTLRPEAFENYKFTSDTPDVDAFSVVQTVWDLDKNAWRSVKKSALLSVDVIN